MELSPEFNENSGNFYNNQLLSGHYGFPYYNVAPMPVYPNSYPIIHEINPFYDPLYNQLNHYSNGYFILKPPEYLINYGQSLGLSHNYKPHPSYISLISAAILESKSQKLVLSGIYQYILDRYPYFRDRNAGWRNSVRHNLSLNECFIKCGRSLNGKGHFWAIHPANLEDFKRGDFSRKQAQKRIRSHRNSSKNEIPIKITDHSMTFDDNAFFETEKLDDKSQKVEKIFLNSQAEVETTTENLIQDNKIKGDIKNKAFEILKTISLPIPQSDEILNIKMNSILADSKNFKTRHLCKCETESAEMNTIHKTAKFKVRMCSLARENDDKAPSNLPKLLYNRSFDVANILANH